MVLVHRLSAFKLDSLFRGSEPLKSHTTMTTSLAGADYDPDDAGTEMRSFGRKPKLG